MVSKSTSVIAASPGNYPRQRGLTCGEFNARGVASALGTPLHLPSAPRLRVRIFGYAFVRDLGDLLEAHGIAAPIRHASHLSREERLNTIRDHIDRGQPVVVAIGNGHLRRGRYSPLARRFLGHYITVYGYDRDTGCFFVYDPYLKGDYPAKIPVGNEVRTSEEMLRDWDGTLYHGLIGMDHVYIAAGCVEPAD